MGIRQAEMLFAGFVKWGFDVRSYSAETRRNYVQRAKQADAYLRRRGHSVFTVRYSELEEYVFSTARTASNRNHIRAGLMAFFDFLIYVGIRTDNPAKDLPRLKTHRRLPHPLTNSEVLSLIRTARALDPLLWALVAVFAHTGLRLDEARCLEWSQFDPPWLSFDATKSRRERRMFIKPEVVKALNAWRGSCTDPRWIFPSPHSTSRPLHKTTLERYIRQLGEVVGIEGMHPHRFRHSFATSLYEQTTGDLRVVQEALGHATIQTTEIYAHVRPVRLREAIERHSYEAEV